AALATPTATFIFDVHDGTPLGRLRRDAALLRGRARHWRDAAALRANQRGLLPVGARDPRLGDRARLHFREPRRAGGDRDGGLGREVRHRDEPLLLARWHS